MQTLKCFQLLIVLVFSMLVSCVEIIEFDTTREGGQLVVDGAIATGSGPFEVYLGRTASAERKTTPLEDASITLFDEQGNSIDYEALGEGTLSSAGRSRFDRDRQNLPYSDQSA
jgi:hypothetical protein